MQSKVESSDMRQVPTWDEYHMDMARVARRRSKDPNTQVGAVIVDADNHIIVTGYNGFVPGVKETDAKWERPTKYDLVVHAEANAIAHAAKKGRYVDGSTMYCTAFPCNNCALLIVASGIRRVVAYELLHGWDDDHRNAMYLFKEAGIKYKIGKVP